MNFGGVANKRFREETRRGLRHGSREIGLGLLGRPQVKSTMAHQIKARGALQCRCQVSRSRRGASRKRIEKNAACLQHASFSRKEKMTSTSSRCSRGRTSLGKGELGDKKNRGGGPFLKKLGTAKRGMSKPLRTAPVQCLSAKRRRGGKEMSKERRRTENSTKDRRPSTGLKRVLIRHTLARRGGSKREETTRRSTSSSLDWGERKGGLQKGTVGKKCRPAKLTDKVFRNRREDDREGKKK